jgi:hypothetical protein
MTKRKIVGFHQDEHDDWVAELECGHNQPSATIRPGPTAPGFVTPQGRLDHIGYELTCPKCETKIPEDHRT